MIPQPESRPPASGEALPIGSRWRLDASGLADLVTGLRERGFEVIGPKVVDDVVTYRSLSAAMELPWGIADEQGPGSYRLKPGDAGRAFGFTPAAESWKRWLTPPDQRLWRFDLSGGDDARRQPPVAVVAAEPVIKPLALLGLRACELAAMAVQEHVYQRAHQPVPWREGGVPPLLIAVQCAQAAATCFCTSMGTGPTPTVSPEAPAFDLCVTELKAEVADPSPPTLLVQIGSERGAMLLAAMAREPATAAEESRVEGQTAATQREQRRHLNLSDPAAFFRDHADSPHWDDVAQRCLACGNCTMVCPTCFCGRVSDRLDVAGATAERWVTWDSCFDLDFSYVHGGSIRSSVASRYRQWLSHKLGSWHTQFGESGCVGCGRCITFCPVGIDLTAELSRLQEESHGNPAPS